MERSLSTQVTGELSDTSGITHRLILLPDLDEPPGWDYEQRLIYKADLPAIRERCSIAYPYELNRREKSSTAVGAEGSVHWAQEEWLENAVTLSAIQLVASASKVRDIHRQAYDTLAEFDSSTADLRTRGARRVERAKVIEASRSLSEIENELTFGVEAAQAFSLIVPSARVDAFHRHLHEHFDLRSNAGVASRLLDRLRAAIDSRILEIDTVETQATVDRRRPLDWTLALLAILVTSPTLVFGFLGSNIAEVPQHVSIFDPRLRYWVLSLGLIPVMVLAVAWGALALVRHKRRPLAGNPR